MQRIIWIALLLVGAGFCTYSQVLPSSELVNNLRLAAGIGVLACIALWMVVTRIVHAIVYHGREGIAGVGLIIAVTVVFGFGPYEVWAHYGVAAVVYVASFLVTLLLCWILLWPAQEDNRRNHLLRQERASITMMVLGFALVVHIVISFLVNKSYMVSLNFFAVGAISIILLIAGATLLQRVELLDPGGKIRGRPQCLPH